MCGINGFNWKDDNLIKNMNSSIKNRGPDDQGIYTNNEISIGNVRLSIIDLSKRGKQPLVYKHKKREVVIVYNGEVYNFNEIRKKLKQKGYKFKSKSDTEVILASYLEWGFECVKKFNGMWGFCIYDLDKKIFFCSRDRLGQKPFYYFFDGEKFIFSSEIKGILVHKKLEINRYENISREAVDFYFSLGFIPAPYSIYKNIFKIEARQNLVFDLEKKKIKKWYYYELPKYKPNYRKEELIREGKEILKDAVKLRMISDVPVGAFLSGGFDSSTVVGVMRNFTNLSNLHTFSIGFDGEYDETEYINIARKFFKTKHHHQYFTEKDFKEMIDLYSFIYDEPFADYSGFPTYKVSKMSKKNVTVCLSGDGGDEIFGGYGRYINAYRLEKMRLIPKIFIKLLIRLLPKKFFLEKNALNTILIAKDAYYSELFSDYEYRPNNCKKWLRNNFRRLLRISRNDLVNAMIFNDLFFITLSDNYLVKVDRASMKNGLEVRSPFLDYRFIEFSSKIPSKWKSDFFQNRRLMKEIIKDIIPEEILNRGKQGFVPPIPDWILTYNIDYENMIEKLYGNNLIHEPLFNFLKDKVLSKQNLTEKLHVKYKIRLLLFNEWVKNWMDEND